MSTWFEVTLTTRQRVSLGTGGQRAYLTRTHPFIPGSVFRGALAAAWLVGGQTDDEFTRAFDGEARFSPLLREGSYVEPQSMVHCKYHRECADHPVHVDRAFGTQPAGCPGGWTELKGGVASPGTISLRTSTALNVGTITAERSKLFSREVLEKGTRLRGWVVVDDDGAAPTQLTSVFVGGRRGVLGRSDVEWRKLAGAPGLAGMDGPVVLRTISPTILVDAAGRPSLDFAGALRAEGFEVADKNVWANRVVTEAMGGWHAASGLPKPSDTALAAGATVVLEKPDVSALRKLIDRGLGLRRSEGFGWLTLAQPAVGHEDAGPGPAVDEFDVDRLTGMNLPPRERAWFAGHLRRLRAGDEQGVDQALAQEGARWLTDAQLDVVRSALLETPNAIRNAVAALVKEGLK